MPNSATTEADLRAALLDLIPDDLDVDGFRAGLTASVERADRERAKREVIDIAEPRRTTSRGRRRGVIAAAVAAAAAIAGVVVAVVPRASDPASQVPASIRDGLLPGSSVLAVHRGSGSETFPVDRVALPPRMNFSATVVCEGSATIEVALTRAGHRLASLTAACSATAGDGIGVVADAVTVRATPATSWTVVLALQPHA